jgi:hypothetical protein
MLKTDFSEAQLKTEVAKELAKAGLDLDRVSLKDSPGGYFLQVEDPRISLDTVKGILAPLSQYTRDWYGIPMWVERNPASCPYLQCGPLPSASNDDDDDGLYGVAAGFAFD